ncbi:MAG: hypothetical protein ACPGJS_21635 [Flammeovirgaceae bacterium]
MRKISSKRLHWFASIYAVIAFVYAFFVLLSGCEENRSRKILQKSSSEVGSTLGVYNHGNVEVSVSYQVIDLTDD